MSAVMEIPDWYGVVADAVRSRTGFVYCIENTRTGKCKIGWSINPFKRLQVLRTGNDDALLLVGWFPGTRRVESKMHHIAADRRIRGEWFDNSDGELIEWFKRQEKAAFQVHGARLGAQK